MLARCTRRASKNRCTVIRAYSTRRDSTFASPALWRPRREDTLRVQQEAFTRESKPVYQNKRGSEHVFNSDIHFPHILHEDEQLGLAFIGVHPLTRKLDIRRFIAKIATVRHCWLCEWPLRCAHVTVTHHFPSQSQRAPSWPALSPQKAPVWSEHALKSLIVILSTYTATNGATGPLQLRPIGLQFALSL